MEKSARLFTLSVKVGFIKLRRVVCSHFTGIIVKLVQKYAKIFNRTRK